MNTQLFIPKKCKAGFDEREDCYTKLLAYVIAYDGKKWRKENSWEGWRDKKLEPVEFDNVPTEGFVLNKKAGGGCSHWNTRRTVSRIYDPRGFEFEIGIENLLYILEHCNCMKGKGLEGQFIYSWDGKDLVLLPVSSPEATKANEYTDLQNCKISAKDLIAGCSYKTKRQEDLIYVGRYMWYETDWYKNKGREGKKCHIFFQEKQTTIDEDGYKDEIGGNFIIKNDVSFLAVKNSIEPVPNFAEIIDNFKKNPRSSDILKFELIPTEVSTELVTGKHDYYGPRLKRNTYFKQVGDWIVEFYVSTHNKYDHSTQKYENKGFTVGESKQINVLNKNVKSIGYYSNYSYNNNCSDKIFQSDDVKKMELCNLFITLESGKKVKLENLNNI